MRSIYEVLTALEEAVGDYDEALERLRDLSEEDGETAEALKTASEARRRLEEVVRSLEEPLEYREDEPADIECLDDIRALLVYVREVLMGEDARVEGVEPIDSNLEERVESAIARITDKIVKGMRGLDREVREDVMRRLSF